jgi:uncharacterized protein YndB with AHSA1/START domain
MSETSNTIITLESLIEAPVKKVWVCWTKPEHIIHWNHASDDWHSPKAENDLQVAGRFNVRMEAKDGSMGFDFEGVYVEVKEYKLIKYKLADGRAVTIQFSEMDNKTKVIESFDAETENSIELQKRGWQAILDNFKKYTEGK